MLPPKQLTPFQLELLQRGRDKVRIERDREVEARVFKLVKDNDKERKRLIKVAIYQKQVLRSSEPIKFRNIWDSDNESGSETNSQSFEANSQSSETNSQSSETNSQSSETNSQSSETNSQSSETNSHFRAPKPALRAPKPAIKKQLRTAENRLITLSSFSVSSQDFLSVCVLLSPTRYNIRNLIRPYNKTL